MSDEQQPKPWRKRHPVLSRVLLFGLGACVIGGLVLLYLERKEQDRQDHLQYLEARLNQLDLVLLKDPSGAEVQKILKEEFDGDDLPQSLRHGALRASAMVAGVRGEFDSALAVLSMAADLAPGPVERFATTIEAARVHVQAERLDLARGLLQEEPPSGQPVLEIWRAIVLAGANTAAEQPGEARGVLDEALEALPRPLPDGPAVTVALTPWTPVSAAHLATRELVRLQGDEHSGEPWRRLLELAPKDYDVAVSAARALQELGFRPDALAAWRRAEALQPDKAAELAAADAVLRQLAEGVR